MLGVRLKSDFSISYLNKIVQGDTFNLMKNIPDNSVDLIICDGPYGVSKNGWDSLPGGIQQFNLKLLECFSKKLKMGASLYLFGKADCIDFIDYRRHLNLKSKIVWYQPGRLAQGRINYTNNYDIICYFVKGNKPKTFNLEEIRVPQLVELSQRLRCEKVPSVKNGKFGKTKFNNKGKNPGNVWGDIKQLTYKSKELISRDALNTLQKPKALIERLVLGSSNKGDLVMDPFCGTGTCPIVCKKNNRNFIAFELDPAFVRLANERICELSFQRKQ